MPSDFFSELGKATARQLAQTLDHRRARANADRLLSDHLGQPMARDQNLDPRGSQNYPADQDDPNETNGAQMLDAEACLHLVMKCISGLRDEEKDKFVEGLSNLLQSDGSGMDGSLNRRSQQPKYGDTGFLTANQGALDRRSGNRRPPAQDAAIRSLQTKSFARRFPDAMNIKFSGTGRY
jgi:hypothetical protein